MNDEEQEDDEKKVSFETSHSYTFSAAFSHAVFETFGITFFAQTLGFDF